MEFPTHDVDRVTLCQHTVQDRFGCFKITKQDKFVFIKSQRFSAIELHEGIIIAYTIYLKWHVIHQKAIPLHDGIKLVSQKSTQSEILVTVAMEMHIVRKTFCEIMTIICI